MAVDHDFTCEACGLSLTSVQFGVQIPSSTNHCPHCGERTEETLR